MKNKPKSLTNCGITKEKPKSLTNCGISKEKPKSLTNCGISKEKPKSLTNCGISKKILNLWQIAEYPKKNLIFDKLRNNQRKN